MEPIKISRTADSLAQIHVNGESLSAVVFNKQIIWPATVTPQLQQTIDESLDLDYDEFEELL